MPTLESPHARAFTLIHLVIPTHGGIAATRPCIEAALAAPREADLVAHVMACEGDAPIAVQWLQSLHDRGDIELHVRPRDAGLGPAMNEILERNRDASLLLVQGACAFPSRWIGRLQRCLQSEPNVATACAFVPDSAVASYKPHARGEPDHARALALDAEFALHNAGERLDVPVAHAACVLFSAAALQAAGPFDGETFAHEGAVEDFCLRATRAGFRHLLCADLFVDAHAPSIDGALAQRLEACHPGFREALEGFTLRDPARPLRRRVDLARLRASPRPRVLLVTHDFGGGVQRHVDDVARLLEPECEVLRLRPAGDDAVEIRWLRPGEELAAWAGTQAPDATLELLRAFGIDRLHLHHVHGLPAWILDLPGALGVPYDVTLHDYFAACPRYHMAPTDDAPCDDAHGRCERCVDAAPDPWGLGLAGWRARFDRFLRGAARVIAPSHDVVARMQRYFPGLVLQQWSHPERALQPVALYKVALLGGLSAIKGSRVLEACAQDAARRKLPLHFHVIGHVDRPMDVLPHAPLTIGGSYADEDLARVIALERPDAWLFLSRVPETYSYTLSVALATGLPIVATALGAIAERLRDVRAAQLVPLDATAAEINDALLAHLRRMRTVPRARVAAPT